jgi:hypothetical protein
MADNPGFPTLINADPIGAAMSIFLYGTSNQHQYTIPVITIETAIYSIVQIRRLPIIPIGRSRSGFLASCAT